MISARALLAPPQALTAHGKKRLASLLSADLAVHHACGQKFQKAKKLAQEAIKLDPRCPLAHHSMGVCHEGEPEVRIPRSQSSTPEKGEETRLEFSPFTAIARKMGD